MKRFLLSVTAMFIAYMAMGQGIYYMPDFYFDKMSPNGKWLATQTEGVVYTYDREADTYYEYIASEDAITEFYGIGAGNCWSNDGILVGKVNDMECAYMKDNEWYELPIDREKNLGLNVANGITPDGRRIVGNIGISGMNMYSEQMVMPVYWDVTPDGDYGMYQILPYPKTDFCGRVPQYITAICVSDDGKTIIGNIVDWSGFYIYPIIYTQDENGEWSYRTICEGVLYPEGAQFGTWPGEEPNTPDPTQFMNDEQAAAYLAALNHYMTEYKKMENGEIDWEDLPELPDPTDYITDKIDAYNAALQEYYNTLENYYKQLGEFQTILDNTMYGNSFILNNLYLSGNGRYINTTIKGVDATNPYNPIAVYTPTLFDLQDGSMTAVKGATDMIASSVMNDGRSIAQNPFMAYGRNSYIVSRDGQTLTPFVDFLAGVDYDMWDFVKSISVYDVIYIDGFDEYGNPSYAVANDSIVSGSVHCNSDGTIFTSFMYDEWSEGDVIRQFSYQVDFTALASVDAVENNNSDIYVANNTLYTQGRIDEVVLYNISGAVVMRITSPHEATALNLPPGIYVVSASTHEGTITRKIALQ